MKRRQGRPKTLFFDDSDNKVQQAATIQNFALAVQGRAELQCSLADGLRSLQIIHGAYVSSWCEGPVKLPVAEARFRELIQKADSEE